MTSTHPVLRGFALITLALAVAHPAAARGPRPPADPTAVRSCAINAAFADTSVPAVTLVLKGGFCDDPSVRIGQSGGELADVVVTYSDTATIEVDLGVDPAPGTRVVLVECDNRVCFMDVAVDAPPQLLTFDHADLSLSGGNTVNLGSLANSAVAYDNASRSLAVTDGSGTLATSLADLAQTVTRSGLDVTLSNGGGTVSVADDDNDSGNELQSVSRSGLDVTLSDGGGTVSVADNDNDSANELQAVSRTGSTVSLSNGGGSVSIDDADSNASNELQTLTQVGPTVSLSLGGGSISVNDGDANPSNELQALSRSGSTVSLSNGGGSVSVNDADASSTNELQSLSRSGNTLSISGGNSVTLPSGSTGYIRLLADRTVSSFTIRTVTWTCAAGCTGGGAINVTDPTDVDFHFVSNGITSGFSTWRTSVTNQGPLDAETYRFCVTYVNF